MNWTKVSRWCIISDAEQFIIAKYWMGDDVWKYGLSSGGKSLCVGTLAECKAAALASKQP